MSNKIKATFIGSFGQSNAGYVYGAVYTLEVSHYSNNPKIFIEPANWHGQKPPDNVEYANINTFLSNWSNIINVVEPAVAKQPKKTSEFKKYLIIALQSLWADKAQYLYQAVVSPKQSVYSWEKRYDAAVVFESEEQAMECVNLIAERGGGSALGVVYTIKEIIVHAGTFHVAKYNPNFTFGILQNG